MGVVRDSLTISALILGPSCVIVALVGDPALAISIAAGGVIAGLNFLLLARKLAQAIDQTLAGVAEARAERAKELDAGEPSDTGPDTGDEEPGVDPATVRRAPVGGSIVRLLLLLAVVAGVLLWPEARPVGLAVGVLVVLVGASLAGLRERRRRLSEEPASTDDR